MSMTPKNPSYTFVEIIENCPPNEWGEVENFLRDLAKGRGAEDRKTWIPVNMNHIYCGGKKFPIPNRVYQILTEMCGPVFNLLMP